MKFLLSPYSPYFDAHIISFLFSIHFQLAPKLDQPMYDKFQFHNLFANEIFTYEHIQPKIRCLSKGLKYVLHIMIDSEPKQSKFLDLVMEVSLTIRAKCLIDQND